ncbi:MAG: hypothetical protein PHS54_05520 [Clostridia bacterium]|nr:hypothetical protein [Clostridia bacterium]
MIFNERCNKIFYLMLDIDPEMFDEIDDYLTMIPNKILDKLQKGKDFKITNKKEGITAQYCNYDNEVEISLKYQLYRVKMIIDISKITKQNLLDMKILKEGESPFIINEIGSVTVLYQGVGVEFVYDIQRTKDGYYVSSTRSIDRQGTGEYEKEFTTPKKKVEISDLVVEKGNEREKE